MNLQSDAIICYLTNLQRCITVHQQGVIISNKSKTGDTDSKYTITVAKFHTLNVRLAHLPHACIMPWKTQTFCYFCSISCAILHILKNVLKFYSNMTVSVSNFGKFLYIIYYYKYTQLLSIFFFSTTQSCLNYVWFEIILIKVLSLG